MLRVLIAVALLCLTGLKCQCPDSGSLRDPDGTKLCARMFLDSNVNSTLSCGGEHMNVYPTDDYPILARSWNNHISSLVVSRFCSLTVWSLTKKQGKRRKFKAGVQHRLRDVRMGLLRNWDNQISGFYCCIPLPVGAAKEHPKAKWVRGSLHANCKEEVTFPVPPRPHPYPHSLCSTCLCICDWGPVRLQSAEQTSAPRFHPQDHSTTGRLSSGSATRVRETSRMSNNMAKIADARKTVEQLKLEVNIDRMMVSKAAADLMAFCEAHAKEDPLVTPDSNSAKRDKGEMANFKGHALPGTFFLLFGLWWSVKYPLRQRWRKAQPGGRHKLPQVFNRMDFVEGVLKIFFAFVGIMAEQFVPDGPHAHLYNSASWVKLMNWQHSTMYLFYGISGVVDILSTSSLPVPLGLDRLALSLAIFVEGFLFYFHVHSRPPLDVHIHSLLLVAVFGGAASTFLEVFMRDNPVLELLRSSLAILQGSWFYQIGFVLYLSGPKWDETLHDNIMFITMCYCWHYAVALLVVGINYTLVCIFVWRLGGRQVVDMEFRRLKTPSSDHSSQKALLQGSDDE
ncbi:hypothetical protein AAFF_G00370230 [Aldrovandia affinis]|uniref:Guanine nucleotide-binding protein subunit gamma n=1 Tax=Aldrovandia affinis TaxID=143900 RepID=A0AAD7SGP4_9TELE|nr:hypothetical protein AAFF_G00370230 [Aldrovandia affinis]